MTFRDAYRDVWSHTKESTHVCTWQHPLDSGTRCSFGLTRFQAMLDARRRWGRACAAAVKLRLLRATP